ncbi:hypothetical protein F511_14803 [Dorcoceras hygrometricum]|uniref:Secreted protein n=1 Tax=Dorcoceras hygrometricum TaxID=472368 RepID=A0A2Z7C7N8_9LAMI|nr:hypothetical protein F511_14803 [Dorcoceras hygrometricum]
MLRRSHACSTLCASFCVMCAQGGRPPARAARTGGAAGARTSLGNVRAPSCATCTPGYRPAGAKPDGVCATSAQRRRSAPGSDQFHEGIGTTVERLDRRLIRSTTRISTPSPICTRNRRKFHGWNLLAEMVRTNSDGGNCGSDDEGRRERGGVC